MADYLRPGHRDHWIKAIWQRIIQPVETISDPVAQRQSRLLASMLLVLAALSLISIVTQPLYDAEAAVLPSPELYAAGASLAVAVVAFVVNRAGRYVWAAALTVAAITVTIFALALPHPGDPGDITWLYYMVVPVLLANVFLPLWATAVLVTACLLGMIALPIVTPVSDDGIPVIFLVAVASLILLLSRHQQQLEAERQRTLAENEKRLRLITDNMLDMIAQVDATGVTRYVSPSIRHMLGYEPGEFVGKPLAFEPIHPDDFPQLGEWLRQTVEAQESVRAEFRYRRRDGRYVWLEMISRPLRDADGTVGGYVLTTRDITARKLSEEALSEREERYRTLARHLPGVIVFLFDHNLRYLMVEGVAPLREQGYVPEEFPGRTLWEVAPPDSARRLEPIYRAALAGQEAVEEHELGSRVYHLHALPIKDAHGEVYAGMVVARDITVERQAAQQRLELAVERERVRTLQQYVDHAASHDLRTPLTIMKTSAYLLGRIEDADKRQRYLQNLNEQVEHLEKVFENILAMSRIYKPETEFDRQVLDVNQVVREVLMNEQGTAAEKQHTLEFTAETDLPRVVGDEYALQLIVTHLVKNAIRFTPDGGRITVRTFRRSGQVVVEIEDPGIGISEQDLPFIFDPFYRADKARPMYSGEMGLGLAIVKRLVEVHRGQIEVESEPGKGSIFRVALAAAGADADDRPTQEARTI